MADWEADVIVVGSGVGGSMAAYAFGRAGVKVAIFEAGRHYDPDSETPMTTGSARRRCAGSARRTSPSAIMTPPSTAAGRSR